MAGASLAVASSAYALSLGEIDVQSNLNQHFVASIPLTEISSEDLETVSVTLGSNEAYDRAGLERADFLSTLSFQIKNDKGRPRVVVNSTQVAKEPVLNLLVQARWNGGKIVRDYTILLDPPASVAPRPAVSAPPAVQRPAPMPAKPLAPAAKPAPAPVIAAAAPARPASPPIPSSDEFYTAPSETKPAVARPATKSQMPALTDPSYDSATSSYGPVIAKETLWSIATKVRPGPETSMDQVILALSKANPDTSPVAPQSTRGLCCAFRPPASCSRFRLLRQRVNWQICVVAALLVRRRSHSQPASQRSLVRHLPRLRRRARHCRSLNLPFRHRHLRPPLRPSQKLR